MGLVAVGVAISDSMEPLVALYYIYWDFLLFDVWTITKRRKFQLTHYLHVCATSMSASLPVRAPPLKLHRTTVP